MSSQAEDNSRCPVHQLALAQATVPIRYGLIRFPPEYLEAQRQLFPYARPYVLGGCVIRDEEMQTVDYCPACREALAAWNQGRERPFGLV